MYRFLVLSLVFRYVYIMPLFANLIELDHNDQRLENFDDFVHVSPFIVD